MADTSVPGRTGPLTLVAVTPQDLVPDPGASTQHVVPRGGVIINNPDTKDHDFVLRVGGGDLANFQVASASILYWPGTVVVLDGETLEVEMTSTTATTAPTATASYMRTD